MIIDAHVHLFPYENTVTTFSEAFPSLLKQMKLSHIDYAIIIPDNIKGPEIGDFEKVHNLIQGHSNLFMLGSPQIIERGDSEISLYQQYAEDGVIKGIKLFPGHDPYYPTDVRCMRYYEMCQNLNLPLVFHTGENSDDAACARFNDPKYIVEIAKQFPHLKVIITHYFWPQLDYCYDITKNIPNIYYELAGTADQEVLDKSGGISKMQTILEKTIQNRPNQVIYGTDWPMCDMKAHIDLVNSLTITEGQKEKIFSQNAIQVYSLPIK